MTIEKEIQPISWQEFKSEIAKLPCSESSRGIKEDWVFRGHADASWLLQSTLERYFIEQTGRYPQEYTYETYVNMLRRLIPPLNKEAETTFKDFEYVDILSCKPELQNFYDLIIYLRHLGFPSPMLDWTYNWKVATYFAFSNANINNHVAIYAYKHLSKIHSYSEGSPRLELWSPNHEDSQRHINQDACYTACLKENDEDKVLASFSDALAENPDIHQVKKFILEGKEKHAILQDLQKDKITTASLFPDSLDKYVSTLAYENIISST